LRHHHLKIFALLFLSLFLSACTGQSAVDASKKIQIGMDASLPPFESFNQNKKEFEGFDLEVFRAVAAKSNLDFVFVSVGNNLLTLVASCQLQGGISAIVQTNLLEQRVNFSEPYYTTRHVILVKTGNIVISGREQLAGMRIGTEAGTVSEDEIDQIAGAQKKTYETITLAVQDLVDGNLDAVIADKPHASGFVAVKRNNLKIVGDEFGSIDFRIAVCKSQPDLLKQINSGLAAAKADGTLDRLAKNWINK
jgi:ABC-type amino acid transport substrate-binding protein